VDYKLALNLLGVGIFAAMFWLSARRGDGAATCGMTAERGHAEQFLPTPGSS
jgi:hypothetical protein